jgi:O-antigen/teichoic acid export membrane protein
VCATALDGDAAAVALPVGIAAAAVVLNGVIAGVFLGQNQIVRYNIALVGPPLAALVAVVVTMFALGNETPEAVLTAFATGQLLSAAALLGLGGRRLLQGARLERQLVGRIVTFAALAGLSSGVSYLNYRADLFVVRQFEGKEGVATYSLAVYIAESVWQVSGSLALATYPRVGALERRPAAELTARVMRHTLVMLGVICAVLFLAADLIQQVLFSQYEGMASALRFILPGIVIYGLAQSFSGFYTYQRGLPWVAAVVAGTGLVLDMVFAITLVPRMGINGASLASALAYSLAMLGALAVFLRRERLSPSDIFHFGRSEIDDYRAFFARVSATLGRRGAGAAAGP